MRSKIPIAIFIYKRPNLALQVASKTYEYGPSRLYIISDGPKNEAEKKYVMKTRRIVEQIPWSCSVKKIYSKSNLGLRKRVVSGLNEVFSKEKSAIILEDDCIPDDTFFKFCSELLDRYKDNQEIISISGSSFLGGKYTPGNSYYFSKFVHSWGWATWKRAWSLYDNDMKKWPEEKETGVLKQWLGRKAISLYWEMIFENTYKGKYDSWAYRWMYTAMKNKKLSITPSSNLIKNVGHGRSATHTKREEGVLKRESTSIEFPLKHPDKIVPDEKADKITEWESYLNTIGATSLVARDIIRRIKT